MPRPLRNAVAYRTDCADRDEWSGARRESIPVSCPSGCAVEYDLFVSEKASGEDAMKWVEELLERLEEQHPYHPDVIAF